MKKFSLIQGLLLAFSLLAVSPKLHAVQFAQLSLAEAKAKASQLQRPLFVHFYASWCHPCQWMDKNTFADPEVDTYLTEKYLAVKIDVDEVQGFSDKEQCGIRYLPSMLVFNASGIVVTRIEETLDAQQMLDLLEKFDTPANRVPSKNSISAPVVKVVTSSSQAAHLTEDASTLSASLDDDPAHLDAQRRPLSTSSTHQEVSGVRQMGVQIGVYSSYETVIRQVQYFEKKFYKTVHISSTSTNGQTYYHLIAGPFEQPAQLQTYLNALQKEGIKGLIVKL